VDPIGDRIDGVGREHLPRHFTVSHRDAVDIAREPEGEQSHVQAGLVARPELLQQRDPGLAEKRAGDVERKPIVARRYRRMGREDALAAHGVHIRIGQIPRAAVTELALEQRNGQQRCVAFIDVMEQPPRAPVAKRAQHLRAANAEDDLLAESVGCVAPIQRVGDAAICFGVLGERRIEQVHGDLIAVDPANPVHPGANLDLAALDLDRHDPIDWLQALLRMPDGIALGLVAGRVEVLVEVSFPVDERDRNHRHAKVRRRPQRVTRQDTKATAVGGDRLLKADLHREIRDRRRQGVGHVGKSQGSHGVWSPFVGSTVASLPSRKLR
jgi:hypothetical protein